MQGNSFLSAIFQVVAISRAVYSYSIPPSVDLVSDDHVTCGAGGTNSTYRRPDGSFGVCEFKCPADRRTFTGDLDYVDVLAPHNESLVDMERPTLLSPGRGYDSVNHTAGLTTNVSLSSVSVTVCFWIYVDMVRGTDNWVFYIDYTPYAQIRLSVRYNMVLYMKIKGIYNEITISKSTWKLALKTWTHISLQAYHSGQQDLQLNLFINGTFVWPTESFQSTIADINTKTVFEVRVGYDAVDLVAKIQDFKIYRYTLTNSEISAIVTGSFPHSGPLSKCLCPGSHPARPSNVSPYCQTNPNVTFQTSRILRLGPRVHPILAAYDGVNDTFWITQIGITNVNFTVNLNKIYELHAIQFEFVSYFPRSVTVTTTDGRSVVMSSGDCQSNVRSCQQFPSSQNTGSLVVNFTDAAVNQGDFVTASLRVNMQGFIPSVLNQQYYAISEIKVYGSCSCNGRSGACNESNPLICTGCEHSHGDSCEFCDVGYYSDQNKTRNGTNACLKCDCHLPGVANDTEVGKCHQETGQCNCKKHVTGRRCDTCKRGYSSLTSSNPDGCDLCSCLPAGSISSRCGVANCQCKVNVMGASCDQCKQGHYNLSAENRDGCQRCMCNTDGTIMPTCDTFTGQCTCKSAVKGRTCDTCQTGYYKMSGENSQGCIPCGCSQNQPCDAVTGQCQCLPNVIGQKCDKCKPGYYANSTNDFRNYGCLHQCQCNTTGSRPGTDCDGMSGQCACKRGVRGQHCDVCQSPHDYLYPVSDENGCKACDCDPRGSTKATCRENGGNCQCKTHVTSRTCGECQDGYWGLDQNDPSGCKPCDCYTAGAKKDTFCDKVTGQCDCRDVTQVQSTGRQCKPFVTSVIPNFGPWSGGTHVLIRGGYFGSNKTSNISIGGLECSIIKSTDTYIICLTSSLNNTNTVTTETPLSIEVTLRDGFELQITEKFTYKEDPKISSVYPLETIPSGGIVLTVAGNNFESVFAPLMNISLYHNKILIDDHLTPCNVSNNTEMLCETPELKIPVGLKDIVKRDTSQASVAVQTPYNDELKVYIGFLLDGVPDYRDLGKSLPQYKELRIYPNPTFDFFTENERVMIYRPYKENSIDIKGKGLRLGRKQFVINIGAGLCRLKLLRVNYITCEPPSRQPDIIVTNAKDPEVKLSVGQKEVHHVGYLRYYHTPMEDPAIRAAVISCIVCFLIIIILVVVVVVIVLKIRRRRRVSKANKMGTDIPFQPISTSVFDDAKSGSSNASPPPYALTLLDEVIKIEIQSCLLERKNLKILNVIGKGHFGKVEEGYYLIPNTQESLHVAVKSMRATNSSNDEIVAFIKEATIMKEFNHPHVLGLIGVVCDSGDPLVVLPFMDFGDLKSYVSNEKINIQLGQLLVFGRQIAEGMAYLSTMRFVHRDLAARNCMIDKEMIVKIADFGLSRDIYETDYYKPDRGKSQAMPIRWMAVESMVDGRYSTETDVWSFGVVFWELVTRGSLPYPDLANHEVKDFVRNGFRMVKPTNATPDIYQLMIDCWRTRMDARPTFPDIVRRLNGILSGSDQLVQSQYADDDYIEPIP